MVNLRRTSSVNQSYFRDWVVGKIGATSAEYDEKLEELVKNKSWYKPKTEDPYNKYNEWMLFDKEFREVVKGQKINSLGNLEKHPLISTVESEFKKNIKRISNGILDSFKVPLDLTDEQQRDYFKKTISKYLDFSGGKTYYIKFGNNFYTLSSRNINELVDLLDGVENEGISESDKKLVEVMKAGEDIVIGRIVKPEGYAMDDSDEAPGGAWFPYYLKNHIPLDLTRYDIHKDSSTEDLSLIHI